MVECQWKEGDRIYSNLSTSVGRITISLDGDAAGDDDDDDDVDHECRNTDFFGGCSNDFTFEPSDVDSDQRREPLDQQRIFSLQRFHCAQIGQIPRKFSFFRFLFLFVCNTLNRIGSK